MSLVTSHTLTVHLLPLVTNHTVAVLLLSLIAMQLQTCCSAYGLCNGDAVTCSTV